MCNPNLIKYPVGIPPLKWRVDVSKNADIYSVTDLEDLSPLFVSSEVSL